MRKLFLLSMIVIILILMASVQAAKTQVIIPHLCNKRAHREMPIVSWDRVSFKAQEKSPVFEWTDKRC